MDTLKDQLQTYHLSANAKEKEGADQFLALYADYASTSPSCFDRECFPGHLTASAIVVWKERETLKTVLVAHKKLNKWLQPGGHADGDKDLAQVALKELQEETGLTGSVLLDGNIFDLSVHKIPSHKDTPEHYHYDVRYLVEYSGDGSLEVSEESDDVRWFDVEALLADSSLSASLKKSLGKILDRLDNQ
jgi:8-oxo-dGTP pyrophosphatase MutT (NUDIX family)